MNFETPINEDEITKDQCESLLRAWGEGRISNKDICDWAELNYLPLTQKLAPGYPNHIGFALGIILSEFEMSSLDSNQSVKTGADAAIEFLNTPISEFRVRLIRFLESCFGSYDPVEVDRVVSRLGSSYFTK